MDRREADCAKKGLGRWGRQVAPEEWGAWLVDILEILEAEAVGDEQQEAAFAQALDEVQRFLERRLMAQWEDPEDS